MRNIMRFLFSPADSADIDPDSLVVQSTPYQPNPAFNAICPESLEISFRTTSGSAPQVQPILPGKLKFIPDQNASGTTPSPTDIVVSEAGYQTWKVQGALMLTVDSKSIKKVRDHLQDLHEAPTRFWYTGITLTKEFLLEVLVNDLTKEKIQRPGGIDPSDPDWEKFAISGFLSGKYTPNLRVHATDTTKDDVQKFEMPRVTIKTDGSFTLHVSAAVFCKKAQDGKSSQLDFLNGAETDNPAHPANGIIPARLVYQTVGANMLDVGSNNAVADKILSTWPSAPRYFKISFTRTWQNIPNKSVFLPQNSVQVFEGATNNELAHQRLPVHGVFYFKQEPDPQDLGEPSISIRINGNMRWLAGETANAWKHPAATDDLQYDFASNSSPHIIVRLPMSIAIFQEKVDKPDGYRCTYMSMRRSLRALVDNRIAGGRLNYQRASTSKETRQLIFAAWNSNTAVKLVANNKPSSNAKPEKARKTIQPIFEAMFPEKSPAFMVDGSNSRTKEYTLGRVAYELWQTVGAVMRSSGTKSNFSDAHIGRGAPAALVALGLADMFHVDMNKNTGDTDERYADDVVESMLSGLEPGAVLQFWNKHEDFLHYKTRSKPGPSVVGHSPLFVSYIDGTDGINVLDQSGRSRCPVEGSVGSRKINWSGYRPEVWIAANWNE